MFCINFKMFKFDLFVVKKEYLLFPHAVLYIAKIVLCKIQNQPLDHTTTVIQTD